MKSLYILIILFTILAPCAYCQVDTLEAIEVGTIQTPDNIAQLYVQDLNDDSLKELILCTSNHIYAYNQADSIPFWISPELVSPTDLQFADIDGDSLLDVSLKDSVCISFFDIFTDSLIYSTETDNLYRLYTIGDANGDDATDLVIVRQEPFDQSVREDTAWIRIYYGPDFSHDDGFFVTLKNFYDNYYFVSSSERPNIIKIVTPGPQNARVPRIVLSSLWQGYGFGEAFERGRFWIVNPWNFEIIHYDDLGHSDDIWEINIYNYYYTITSIYKLTRIGAYPTLRYNYTYKLGLFSSNGLLYTTTMCSVDSMISNGAISNWSYCMGEENPNSIGPEFFYRFQDSIHEYSIANRSWLWTITEPADSIITIGTYNSPLFPSPEILVKEILPSQQYLFINGVTPQVNTILPNIIPSISQISDLNNDGNDEILSISGNTLHIYNLDWATPVAEKPVLPSEYLTVSNYPNPFNGQTVIKYNLPKQCDMALEIYDILGRKIESVDKPNQPAGLGQITWSAAGEPSGVYFYRLSAGNEQKSGRMVLLK